MRPRDGKREIQVGFGAEEEFLMILGTPLSVAGRTPGEGAGVGEDTVLSWGAEFAELCGVDIWSWQGC